MKTYNKKISNYKIINKFYQKMITKTLKLQNKYKNHRIFN